MEKITDWLLANNAIRKDEIELYIFGIKSFVYTFIPFFLSVIMGICFGEGRRAILFLFLFLMVRKFTGGYHMNSAVGCIICSTVVLITNILIIKTNVSADIFEVPVYLLTIVIWVLSPVENENRPLSVYEYKKYKVISRLMIILLLLVYTWLNICEFNEMALVSACVIMLVGSAQIPIFFRSQLMGGENANSDM